MKELDQIVLLKGLFNKTAPLFEKWAREESRMTGEGWIPLSRKLFLVSFVYIKKNLFFFKKGTFSEASDHLTLYLSKTGPGLWKKWSLRTQNWFLNVYINAFFTSNAFTQLSLSSLMLNFFMNWASNVGCVLLNTYNHHYTETHFIFKFICVLV